MRKLVTVFAVFFFTVNAYALVGSFFQNDKEYGLTDKLYSVSELENLTLPDECNLISCSEAVNYLDNLTYSVDYFICDGGIVNTHSKEKCSIVKLSGKKYVECNGNFLPENEKFRALVSCPIFPEENATENATDNETPAYLNFTPENGTYYCAKDINGNNFFDNEAEIQQCIKADNGKGYVCPIDKVSCEATYEKPLCPEGTLNTERDMCQADAVIKCPSGYKWDSSLDKCLKEPECPDGGTFNPETDRCEKKVINECPDGYSYDPNRDVCYKNVTCPSGTTYNPSTDRCEKDPTYLCPTGYTYNYSIDKCEMSPSCPSGTTYNPERDRCEKNLGKCPEGYTYNAALDKCVRSVECPDGGTLNPNTDKCELQATKVCPDGWTLNESTGKCEKTPVCPEGGTYSKKDNLCFASITGTVCPKGYTYSSALKTCIREPVCPSGSIYNKKTDRCEAYPSYDCPSGWSYNSSLKVCERNPSCPSGMTYNSERNRCEKAINACPEGYTYNKVLNKCVKEVVCPNGGVLNSSTDKCELEPDKVCPSGWTLNESSGKCERKPDCPSGSSYDKNLNLCVLSAEVKCPDGYTFSSKLNACVKEPECPSGSTYNANTNRCETLSEPECPEGWTYNADRGKCEKDPECPKGWRFSYEYNVCYKPISCPEGYTYNAVLDKCIYSGEICPQRGVLNPDTDKCEIVANTECPEGYTYDNKTGWCKAPPICPEGSTFDSQNDVCIAPAKQQCPSGYTYSDSLNKCMKTPYCYHGTYNPSTDRCERNPAKLCPFEFHYNSSTGKCEKNPECPSGMTYSSSLNKCIAYAQVQCPSGYTYNSSTGRCEANPICPEGFTYNSSTNRCETGASISYTCSSNGQSYSSLATCQANCQTSGSCSGSSKWEFCFLPAYLGQAPMRKIINPNVPQPDSFPSTCPNNISPSDWTWSVVIIGEYETPWGFILAREITSYTCSLNGQSYSDLSTCQANCKTTGICSQKGSCPSGSTLSGSLCIANPSCPSGGTFDGNSDVCYTSPSYSCSVGTYDSSSGYCVANVYCGSGSLNPTTDKCEANVQHICLYGYTYSSSEKICYRQAYCSSGGTLDKSSDLCVYDVDFQCPEGFIYSSSLGACYKDVSCPSTTSWHFYSKWLDECISGVLGTPECPQGYTLKWKWGKGYYCEADVSCPSPGHYNSEENVCEVYNYQICKQFCQDVYGDDYYFCPYFIPLHGCIVSPSCPVNPKVGKCQQTPFHKCPPGFSLEGDLVCYASASCSNGELDTSKDLCLSSPQFTCPSGYSYSSSYKLCYTSADCGSGSLNASKDLCQLSYGLKCQSPYSLNGNVCQLSPSCPSPGNYDKELNLCTANVDFCGDYNFDSNLDLCYSGANCYQGTLNTLRDKCELSPNVSCKQTGFTLQGEICYASATCPESGNLDTSDDYCKVNAEYLCPSGYSYSSSYEKCYRNPDCGSGSLNPASDVCQLAYTLTCPAAYSLSGTICQLTPFCPSPGSYNKNINFCDAGNNLCGSLHFDASNDICYISASCSGGGVLNKDRDKCEVDITGVDCGSYEYDASARVCHTKDDYCGSNPYDDSYKQCIATVSKNCGTYNLSSEDNQLCIKEIECPKDSSFSLSNTVSYSSVLDKCISDAEHVCPSGDTYVYTWNKDVLKCEAVPICVNGVYTPETDGCYVGDLTCPIGDYPCLPIGGENYCSPNSCQKWDDAVEIDDTPEGVNDKDNDGEVDESGCKGTIYIFNGNDYRCRPPGLQTGGSNCCKKTTTWFGLGQCSEREKILAKLRSWGKLDGRCHYVGSYCAVKVLKICIQKKKTYCCFHSVLARIIQEQGRQQLGIDWGEPKSPNCRGFTPEEFQRIDFSKIDFSEWYEDLQKRIKENLNVFKNEIPEKIQNYYENLQKY